MQIPIELESSTDFAARVAALVPKGQTRIYIDTSFLMWLTKIGRISRRQFLEWLTAECPDRVHVPVWAAHEYLRHHVAGTIVDELDKIAKELADIANRSYANLRPFLDDPLAPGALNAETQQVAARDALNELQRLASTAKRWNKEHNEHAAEVITFINSHVPENTSVFDFVSNIEAISLARFNGRLPPGFQDRRKKEQVRLNTDAYDDSEVRIGSNHWGDLIFWKEILDHARKAGAEAVIILTNDRKNDWYLNLGGPSVGSIDPDLLKLKARWKPVPCTHPMLGLEARLEASVADIVLLDAPYLGALLRSVGGERVKAFIDVAIVPDPPRVDDETDRRKKLLEEHLKQRELEDAKRAEAAGFRFPDGPNVTSGQIVFERALYESRKILEVGGLVGVFLAEIVTTIEGGNSIADLLTKERVEPLTNSMLTSLARELHDRGLAKNPGYRDALTDLVSLLSELPELTAASLYLGLLASMYIDRASNKARLPPRSPIAPLLFERQGSPYAVQPIAALQKKFAKLEHWPLYIPDTEPRPIEAQLDHVPVTDGEVILGSLRLAGQQIFTRTQGKPDFTLSTLFKGHSKLYGREVVESACKLFAVPFDQVTPTDAFDRQFSFEPTAGFKSPPSVYIDNEEAV